VVHGDDQPAFVPVLRELLGRFAHADDADWPRLLTEMRALWRATGQAQPGQRALDVFTPAPKEGKPDKARKRRY
jgi:hypothetical protein